MFKEYDSLAKMTLLLFDFNIMANVENIFETNNTFTAENLPPTFGLCLLLKTKQNNAFRLLC